MCLCVCETNSMIIAVVMSKPQAVNYTIFLALNPSQFFNNALKLIAFITISNHFYDWCCLQTNRLNEKYACQLEIDVSFYEIDFYIIPQ